MAELKNENFVVIQGFMVKNLKLKGNELIIYACIYGFTQAENQKFSGSLQYLTQWTNSTKQGVMKALNNLIKKGLIVKETNTFNNVKFVSYYATKFTTPMQQSLIPPMQQSLPNNIYIDNIEDNIKKENNNSIIKEKHKYGEYKRVLLTDNEYSKLVKDFGEEKVKEQIQLVDEYVESNNNKNNYTNFNIVIRKSIRQNWFNKGSKPVEKPKQDYSDIHIGIEL